MEQFYEVPPVSPGPDTMEGAEVLGTGSMADAYYFSDQNIVVKCVGLPYDPMYSEALELEMKIFERLGNHPGIIPYFGRNYNEGGGLLLGFAEYNDLESFCDEWYWPRVPVRFRWCVQMAEALAFVHSKGVVHGDITWRNVLVTSDMDAKLSDFAGSSIDGRQFLATGNPPFYPWKPDSRINYRWPADHFGIKDDIFALGTLIYTIMVGEPPYDDLTPKEIAIRFTEPIQIPPIPQFVDHRIRLSSPIAGAKFMTTPMP